MKTKDLYQCVSKNARQNNNQLTTYYQGVRYLLKNTTIHCEYYLQ